MTNKIHALGLGLACVLFAVAAGGCNKNKVTAEKVRDNMSPELQSMAMTHEQRQNAHARTIDTTLRQVWDDLDMILLLDKPIKLTRYPVP